MPTELTARNATAAIAESRLEYTRCARPDGALRGMPRPDVGKLEGYITDVFVAPGGQHYLRAVKGAEVAWFHVTVREGAAAGGAGGGDS